MRATIGDRFLFHKRTRATSSGFSLHKKDENCRFMYGKDESVPRTNIIKPTSGKYGSNSSFLFYESRIYFLTSVRRAFMDAHLFKEIEETLQSDGVGAS